MVSIFKLLPIDICNLSFCVLSLKVEIGSGEDLTEEFLQQRLYPNKSLTRLRFALPQGPEKRKPSPNRSSPDIRTYSCDRRKSSMARFVDVTTKGPEKRKPSPDRCSPDILIRTPSCDRRKSSMPRFVDVSNIATGNSVFTGFFIYVFHFVSLLVGKVKALFSFATRF